MKTGILFSLNSRSIFLEKFAANTENVASQLNKLKKEL